jgi:class 3 adenylate cyclase/tetratricopeptide (TPR) repeat protein
LKCPRCLADNSAQSNFCVACGARLLTLCEACDAAVQLDARFCHQCGQALPGAARPIAPRFAAPDVYTPSYLIDKILKSKSSIEGERKQVTVLFADLKGSMELLAASELDEAGRILDPVIERMIDAVHHYEGTVSQVTGDGIMALFGAPLSHEDHTARACYAALLMQQKVKSYATSAAGWDQGTNVQIRVGLNSGDAIVRSIGTDLRMDYTAIGKTIHLASRMEQMASPGSILIPADAARLAEGYVRVKPLGRMQVKGLAEPVEVCEVIGAGSVRTRLQLSAARGLTPFAGRTAEQEQLSQALVEALGGHGQVRAVIGEPGIGKSRLFYEFIHAPAMADCRVLEASSVSYGKARSYLPIVDLIKAYFRVAEGDDWPEIHRKVTSLLAVAETALQAAVPAFLALLDVPVAEEQWNSLDPPQRRHRIINGVLHLLLHESALRPLVIIIENLHWIDAETQALLDALVDKLSSARILLLLNSRPEYEYGWHQKSYFRELRLQPLSAADGEELLRSIIGNHSAVRSLKRLLIERTEGNPFFLEESIRTLVETGVLVGERGDYRRAKDVTTIQVAPTVQAVLAARIDRLAPEAKRLLQSAAVIGKDVPFPLLCAIADASQEEVRQSLAQLQAAEFLYETVTFPDPSYTFKHALTHEVSYRSLLNDTRRLLHGRIVDAIEELCGERLSEQVEQLAGHALKAELWEKALNYLRQSGTKALAGSANREAVSYFEQALGTIPHLPDGREIRERAIDIRFDLRNSLLPLGEFERLHGYLQATERLARALSDQRRLGWSLIYRCHYLWMTGQSRHARATGQDAHAIAERLGDFELSVVTSFYLGLACFAAGDYHAADVFLTRAVESLRGEPVSERCGLAGYPAAMSHSYLGLTRAQLGDFAGALLHAEQGVRLAEHADHPYSLVVACWSLGSVYAVKGLLTEALPVLERALTLTREWQLTVLSPLVTGALGHVYSSLGRISEGLSLLRVALNAMEAMGRGAYHSLIVAQIGEACAKAGRVDDARRHAERAVSLARSRGEAGYEGLALCVLAEIIMRAGPAETDMCERNFRAANALAAHLGMRPVTARCSLGLAALYRRAGRTSEAEKRFAEALSLYRAMQLAPPEFPVVGPHLVVGMRA